MPQGVALRASIEVTVVNTVRKGKIYYSEFFWDAEALDALGLSERDAHR